MAGSGVLARRIRCSACMMALLLTAALCSCVGPALWENGDEEVGAEGSPHADGPDEDVRDGPVDGEGDADVDVDDGGEPYADVARLGREGLFDREADGSWSLPMSSDYPIVGQRFYGEHADEYDFLVVYTEGELMEFYALAVTVDYSISGIGSDDFAAYMPGPSEAGSAGRLQQINIMNSPSLYAIDPAEASILVHETTHRWAANILLDRAPSSTYLLDSEWGGHWNIYANTGGPSSVGYGDLEDLGDGRFRFSVIYPLRLSPLELYLAGLIGPDEVPPMFFVLDPTAYDPPTPSFEPAWTLRTCSEDATFRGTKVDFTIDDVIASNGPRIPAASESPNHFRFAFVLVCEDVTACREEDLAIVEAQRQAFPAALSEATSGLATADTSL